MNTFQALFSDKLVNDDRLPYYSFTDHDAFGGQSFGILLPKSSFHMQLTILLSIQTIVSAILAIMIYQFIILPQKAKPAAGLNISPFLIGFGVILPIIFYEPIWILDYLRIQNVSMKMMIIAVPANFSLRCLEAMFGFTPEGPKKSMLNYIIFASCFIGSRFDSTTHQPLRVSRSSTYSMLRDLIFTGLATSILMSLLAPFNYVPFEVKAVENHPYDFMNMFSVNHLMNNFIMALLLSVTLGHSIVGVGLLYNICYQVQTVKMVNNPMFTSKSPSDFWGRKWNTHIHSALKGSIFKPARMHFPKAVAVSATFVASGLLHEYVIWILYRDATFTPSYGKNMIFFGWNGVLILLESIIGRFTIFKYFKWMGKRLPGPLISVLVVLTALPLAHLFLSDWIAIGFFHDFHQGIIMIVPLDN